MKKNYSLWISALACLLSLVCVFQVNGLKTKVDSVGNDLSLKISNLQSSVGNITYTVSDSLKAQASILSSYDYEYGEPDYEKNEVPLSVFVAPKEYTKGQTRAYIIIDGEKTEMELENSRYTANLDVSLFDDLHVTEVVFEAGDTVRTESLDLYISPPSDFLWNVYADWSYSGTSSVKNGCFVANYSGDINVNINYPYSVSEGRAQVYLLEVLDGKEQKRTEIGKNVLYDCNYSFDEELKVPFGSLLELYTVTSASDGFQYVNKIAEFDVDSKGNLKYDNDYDIWIGSDSSIYDEKGNLLVNGNERY